MKRVATTQDWADIAELEGIQKLKKLILMTREELYAHSGWQCCTFDGARKQVLLRGLQATFREKLEWLEEAEMLSLRFRADRDSHSNQELLPRL